MGFNFPWPSFKAAQSRYTMEHFQKIQNKVNNLIQKGHDHIWLMGISNGTHSVIQAGSTNIQGAEGLILINPPGMILWSKMKKIELPILAIAHEKDGGPLRTISPEDIKDVCPSSINPELVILSGGNVGKGRDATQMTQRYQHGLSGLERQFARTAIRFIESNRPKTESEVKD